MYARLAALGALTAVAAATACGEPASGPITPPPPPADTAWLAVTLTAEPDTIAPGAQSVVTARAALPDSLTLSLFTLSLSGFGGDTTLVLPVERAGTHEYQFEIRIANGPIEGEIILNARARAGALRDSARATLTIRDDGPPQLFLTTPTIVAPPTPLTVRYQAQDAAGITQLAVHFSGALERDTVLAFAYATQVTGTLKVALPPTAAPGDSVTVRGVAWDAFGKSSEAVRALSVADSTPPVVTVRVDTLTHPELAETMFTLVFFPGDTVRVHVTAADNHKMTLLGYRMLTFGDSIVPEASADSAVFELELPPGTNDVDAFIDVFAADSSGNRTQQRVYAVVMDGAVRPFTSVNPLEFPLIEYDQQGGYVLDEPRDRLYYTTFQNRVEVLGLSPLALLPPVTFGASVRSVDLLPGGDSLAALVLGRPNLLILWEIGSGAATADTIPVDSLGNCDAWDMQVAANGRALVTGWSTSGCPTVEVDLATGAQRTLAVPPTARNLVGSSDHGRIVAWDQYRAVVYDGNTGSLGTLRTLFTSPDVELAHAGPSLDRTGSGMLIRNRLYAGDLVSYRWLLPDPGYFPSAQALSADGGTAYVGDWPGYWKVDAATGEVLDRVILPRIPWRMIAHPDGRRLIVFGWRWVGVIDVQ